MSCEKVEQNPFAKTVIADPHLLVSESFHRDGDNDSASDNDIGTSRFKAWYPPPFLKG